MMDSGDVIDNVTFTSVWVNASLDDLGNLSAVGNDTERGQDGVSVVGMVVVGVILTLLVLCTVIGNVMVLLAVYVNSHLRSTTNYFIVNLAIADLLLGTTVLPFSASLEVFKKWIFGQLVCDIWAAIDVLCCTASIFSLCVISIDRYIGVTRPLQRSTILTERRAVYVIVSIWLLALAISVAPLVGWKEADSPNPYECTVTKQTGYVIFSVSASFYIPLSIILLVYFRIYREAIKHSRFLATGVQTTKNNDSGVTLRMHKGGGGGVGSRGGGGCRRHQVHGHCSPQTQVVSSCSGGSRGVAPSPAHQSSSSSERSENSVCQRLPSRSTAAGKVARFKRETKAAKTLGIVVGVFILCWFPFFLILPLSSLCPQCNIPPLLFNIFFWLGYCNSLMNPVIYACSSREFQFAFRRILRCQYRHRPRIFLAEQEEQSSSGHDGNQPDEAKAHSLGQWEKAGRSGKKSRERLCRTFRSSRWSSGMADHNHSVPVNQHVYDSTPTSHDTRLTDSPTDSLRQLQCQIGMEFHRNASPVVR